MEETSQELTAIREAKLSTEMQLEAAVRALRNSIELLYFEKNTKASTEGKAADSRTVSTSKPQCNEVTPTANDHTDQLHQKQGGASNLPSTSQSKGARSIGPEATPEDMVQASDAKN